MGHPGLHAHVCIPCIYIYIEIHVYICMRRIYGLGFKQGIVGVRAS